MGTAHVVTVENITLIKSWWKQPTDSIWWQMVIVFQKCKFCWWNLLLDIDCGNAAWLLFQTRTKLQIHSNSSTCTASASLKKSWILFSSRILLTEHHYFFVKACRLSEVVSARGTKEFLNINCEWTSVNTLFVGTLWIIFNTQQPKKLQSGALVPAAQGCEGKDEEV